MTTTLPTDDRDPRLRALLAGASLDAPRIDLWERLETPVLALERRRRAPARALRALVAALALLLAGGAMLAIFSLADDEPERASDGASVPDLLLLETWDTEGHASVQAWLPQGRAIGALLSDVEVSGSTISQDGRQLLYAGWTTDGDVRRHLLWSFDAETLEVQWEQELGRESVARVGRWPSGGASVVVVGDAVYVATHRWDTADPVSVTAFDRATGALRDRASVEIVGWVSGTPSLYAAPDGSALHLTTSIAVRPETTGVGNQTAFISLSLPDLREVRKDIPLAGVAAGVQFSSYDTAITPDGRALWQLGVIPLEGDMAVTFLDLATGEVAAPLRLPAPTSDAWFFQHGISPDGTRLSVFYPSTGNLLVVNLLTRAIEQQVVVDLSRMQFPEASVSIFDRAWRALRSLVVEDAAAKVYVAGELQFSRDGTRMYAVAVQGDALNGEPRGVLEIDTRTWQVERHWLPDEAPSQLVLGADDRFLYVKTSRWNDRSSDALIVFDTERGEEAFRVDAPYGTLVSLPELYRARWGVSPARGGAVARPADIEPFAKLVVSASATSLVAGDTVTIEARFVDPRTGETVGEGDDDVRYDPPEHVRALLAKGSGDPQTVVLTQVEEGVYRGAARLGEAGGWSVKVVAEREGEPQRSVALASRIIVQPALTGTDGRRYRLAVDTDPSEPSAGADTVVTISIVDSETGAPLPAGVGLPGGLPDEIDASFYEPQLGVSSRTFAASGRGSWRGTYRFFAPGSWTVRADFPGDGERAGGVQAGVVVVR